jgi:hypothetical protein
MLSLAKAFAILSIMNNLKGEYDKAMKDGELTFEELSDLIIGFIVGLAKALMPSMPDQVVAKLEALVESLANSKEKVEARVMEVTAILDKADGVYEKFQAQVRA